MGLKIFLLFLPLFYCLAQSPEDFYSTRATLDEEGIVQIDELSYHFHEMILSAEKARFSIEKKDRLYGEKMRLKGLDFALYSPACLVDRSLQKVLCSQTKQETLRCDFFTDWGVLSGTMEGALIYREDGLIHMDISGPLEVHSTLDLCQFNAGSALFSWNSSKKLSRLSLFSEKKALPLSCHLKHQSDEIWISAEKIDYDIAGRSLQLSGPIHLKIARNLSKQEESFNDAAAPSAHILPANPTPSMPNFAGTIDGHGCTELELCLSGYQPVQIRSSQGFHLSENQLRSNPSSETQISLNHDDLSILGDQLFCIFGNKSCGIMIEGRVKAAAKIADHFYGMICDRLFYNPLSCCIELYGEMGRDVLIWDQKENMALRLASVMIEEHRIICKGAVNFYVKEGQFHEVFDQLKSMKELASHVISR